MTREQIGAEKIALQKSLLYYESIHGRPVSRPPSDKQTFSGSLYCVSDLLPAVSAQTENLVYSSIMTQIASQG